MAQNIEYMRPVKVLYGPNNNVRLIDIDSGQEISKVTKVTVIGAEKDYLKAIVEMNISQVEGSCDIIDRVNGMSKNGV